MVSHKYKKGDYIRHSYTSKNRGCLYMLVLQLVDKDYTYRVKIIKDQDTIMVYKKGSIHKFGLGCNPPNIKVMSEREVILELL